MCIATLAVAGTVLGATGAVVGGVAQGEAAAYQGQVARNNAQIAQQNATYSASAGAAQTEQASAKAAARDSQVRAGLAANNVDVSTGSAMDIQTSQRQVGQLDAETVANNAALQAYGYETQSTSFEAQSKLDNMEATYAPIEGVLKAGSIVGSGAASGAFGAGGAGGAGAAGGASPSLISGEPSLPEGYQWMAHDSYDYSIGS